MGSGTPEKDGNKPVLVRDVVEKHRGRKVPVVSLGDSLEKVVREIEYFRHSRRLYVVDEQKSLLGCITQRDLVGHVFHRHKWDSIHPRGLLEVITTETARDLMVRETVHGVMDEEVEGVVKRMLSKGVEEIPVLDESGKVVADLTMIDLMKAMF